MVDPIYTLIMASAIGVGELLARKTQGELPLRRREKFYVGLSAFCGAMLGAKLPLVLADWDGFVSGAAWFASGKTIICGLVGGYFGVKLAKWILVQRMDSTGSPPHRRTHWLSMGRYGSDSPVCVVLVARYPDERSCNPPGRGMTRSAM